MRRSRSAACASRRYCSAEAFSSTEAVAERGAAGERLWTPSCGRSFDQTGCPAVSIGILSLAAGSAVTLLPGAVGGVTVGWLKAGAVTTTTSRAAEVNNVVRMCIASQIEP
jgi:hypothetical protein